MKSLYIKKQHINKIFLKQKKNLFVVIHIFINTLYL